MKILFLGHLVIAASIFACNAQQGLFINNQEADMELYISKDRFALMYGEKSRNYALYCNDTISYGYWTKVKGHPLIKLYSDTLQLSSLVEFSVTESQHSGEGLKFVINNPIESLQRKYNSGDERQRLLQYSINLKSDNVAYDCSMYNEGVRKEKYNYNQLFVNVNDKCRIDGFEIFVFRTEPNHGWPDSSYSSVFYTLEYKIVNPESNFFQISMPDLTPCFIAATRINGSLALVEKNSIEFNGILFKRKNP